MIPRCLPQPGEHPAEPEGGGLHHVQVDRRVEVGNDRAVAERVVQRAEGLGQLPGAPQPVGRREAGPLGEVGVAEPVAQGLVLLVEDRDHVEERVGDAGVGPVKEQVAVGSLGHVPQVQVAVQQRGRDGGGRELAAHRRQPGPGGGQLGLLAGRQPGRGVDPGEPARLVDRRQPALRLGGQPGQPAVKASRPEQPAHLGGRPDLQPGEGGQHVLADLNGGVPAQHGPEVGHRHPAALGVDGQGGGHVVGEQPGQLADDDRLVDEQRRVAEALNQTSPETVGARRMHDSSHNWTCCTGPVAALPRVSREPRSQPSAAWNHPRAAQGALPGPTFPPASSSRTPASRPGRGAGPPRRRGPRARPTWHPGLAVPPRGARP
jgi:hypothetical protein